eukprot:403367557
MTTSPREALVKYLSPSKRQVLKESLERRKVLQKYKNDKLQKFKNNSSDTRQNEQELSQNNIEEILKSNEKNLQEQRQQSTFSNERLKRLEIGVETAQQLKINNRISESQKQNKSVERQVNHLYESTFTQRVKPYNCQNPEQQKSNQQYIEGSYCLKDRKDKIQQPPSIYWNKNYPTQGLDQNVLREILENTSIQTSAREDNKIKLNSPDLDTLSPHNKNKKINHNTNVNLKDPQLVQKLVRAQKKRDSQRVKTLYNFDFSLPRIQEQQSSARQAEQMIIQNTRRYQSQIYREHETNHIQFKNLNQSQNDNQIYDYFKQNEYDSDPLLKLQDLRHRQSLIVQSNILKLFQTSAKKNSINSKDYNVLIKDKLTKHSYVFGNPKRKRDPGLQLKVAEKDQELTKDLISAHRRKLESALDDQMTTDSSQMQNIDKRDQKLSNMRDSATLSTQDNTMSQNPQQQQNQSFRRDTAIHERFVYNQTPQEKHNEDMKQMSQKRKQINALEAKPILDENLHIEQNRIMKILNSGVSKDKSLIDDKSKFRDRPQGIDDIRETKIFLKLINNQEISSALLNPNLANNQLSARQNQVSLSNSPYQHKNNVSNLQQSSLLQSSVTSNKFPQNPQTLFTKQETLDEWVYRVGKQINYKQLKNQLRGDTKLYSEILEEMIIHSNQDENTNVSQIFVQKDNRKSSNKQQTNVSGYRGSTELKYTDQLKSFEGTQDLKQSFIDDLKNQLDQTPSQKQQDQEKLYKSFSTKQSPDSNNIQRQKFFLGGANSVRRYQSDNLNELGLELQQNSAQRSNISKNSQNNSNVYGIIKEKMRIEDRIISSNNIRYSKIAGENQIYSGGRSQRRASQLSPIQETLKNQNRKNFSQYNSTKEHLTNLRNSQEFRQNKEIYEKKKKIMRVVDFMKKEGVQFENYKLPEFNYF